jgi:flavodoxin
VNALIVYDSTYGNTERIARAIAGRLGGARLLKAAEAGTGNLADQPCDLLIVGGPTQRHAASPAMRALLEDLPRGACKGTRAAAFDTRYRTSSFLTGSAASWIAGRLKRAGASLVLPPESFFMERDAPPQGEKRRHELERLEPGEEQRAGEWAAAILACMMPI